MIDLSYVTRWYSAMSLHSEFKTYALLVITILLIFIGGVLYFVALELSDIGTLSLIYQS